MFGDMVLRNVKSIQALVDKAAGEDRTEAQQAREIREKFAGQFASCKWRSGSGSCLIRAVMEKHGVRGS